MAIVEVQTCRTPPKKEQHAAIQRIGGPHENLQPAAEKDTPRRADGLQTYGGDACGPLLISKTPARLFHAVVVFMP